MVALLGPVASSSLELEVSAGNGALGRRRFGCLSDVALSGRPPGEEGGGGGEGEERGGGGEGEGRRRLFRPRPVFMFRALRGGGVWCEKGEGGVVQFVSH